jgi:hypothetical protein
LDGGFQAIVGKGDRVWGKEHVGALRNICPMLTGARFGDAATAEIEGYGSSKLTVESAVKYLQLGHKLFVQAELFHFCAGNFLALFRFWHHICFGCCQYYHSVNEH